MPVQLPTLKRFDPSVGAPADAPQIQDKPLNLEADQDRPMAALRDVGNQQEEFIQKYQENAAETKSQDVVNQYATWARFQRGELKKLQGDPSAAYSQYDKDSTDQKAQLLADNDNVDTRTKALIQKKFQNFDTLNNDALALQQGTQTAVYQNQVMNAGVQNAKDAAVTYTGLIAAGDPTGFDKFRASLDQVSKPILDQARTNGLLPQVDDPNGTLDADGNIARVDGKPSPILTAEIKKQIGGTVSAAVKILNNGGHTEQAQQLMDEYADQMTPAQQAALSTDHSAAVVRKQGSAIADKYRNVQPDVAYKAINSDTSITDPEIRQKALQIVDQQATLLKKSIDLRQEAASNQASDYVNQKQFVNAGQLQDDPVTRNLMSKMNQKQRDSLIQQVVAPKTTDPEAKASFQQLIQDNKLTGMTAAQMNSNLTGLNTADRERAWTQWQNANHVNTSGQFKQVQFMTSEVQKQLAAAGVIKRNPFGNGYQNKYQDTITQAGDAMQDLAATLPANATPADLQKAVKNYVGQTVKDKVFNPAAVQKFQSSPTAAPSAPQAPAKSAPPPQAQSAQVTNADFGLIAKAFAAENGGKQYSRSVNGPIESVIQKMGGIQAIRKKYGGQ